MSGGNKASEDNARLEQPKDAVRMESMLQPVSTEAPLSAPPSTDAAVDKNAVKVEEATPAAAGNETHAATTSPSTGPATSSSPADQSEAAPPASPKGKERETAAPPPPSKEPAQDPTMDIEPAVDDIGEGASSAETAPICNINLLLTSGSRHPYKIDAKYLNRRNVVIPETNDKDQPDPFSISVYTLKELILREWRSDWEAKPASPSSIRLIHFGKLLDDKEQLKKYLLNTENPNVMHMSIRPQDLDEEEPKSGSKNLGAGGGDSQRQRSGGCCVVL